MLSYPYAYIYIGQRLHSRKGSALDLDKCHTRWFLTSHRARVYYILYCDCCCYFPPHVLSETQSSIFFCRRVGSKPVEFYNNNDDNKTPRLTVTREDFDRVYVLFGRPYVRLFNVYSAQNPH